MNITKSVALYLQSLAFATLGTDMYIGSVPQDGPEIAWWLTSAGGSPQNRNDTGELIKKYSVNVYFRDLDAENVYETLQELEQIVNAENCPQLEGFDTIYIEATTFPTDQDIDNTDRTVGLVQITIEVYSE